MGQSIPKHSKRSATLNGYYQRSLKQERKERRTAFILAPDFVKVGSTSGSTALSFALGQACARELDKLGFDTKRMREHVLTHVPLAPSTSRSLRLLSEDETLRPVGATAMAG